MIRVRTSRYKLLMDIVAPRRRVADSRFDFANATCMALRLSLRCDDFNRPTKVCTLMTLLDQYLEL